ncbi:hypothetical protein SO802_011416 [Lithocarpus litseifolius]|uniref:Large ribosomal subunit protein bL12 C-terminal domain-containing protein n=1 Tax=Lithocarpus litseifolius TaxID=425828 RepID=A0AAW2CZX7_9ROSI
MATETRTQKLERIVDEIRDLTKLELYDYSVLWRHKMGLNKYGQAVFGLGSSAASESRARSGVEAKAAEKSAFDLKLEKYDVAAKIKIIKEVRTFTDLGLKEAKELVKKVPVVLKKGLTKEEVSPKVSLLLGLCLCFWVCDFLF